HTPCVNQTFDPSLVDSMDLNEELIDAFKCIPSLNAHHLIPKLKAELVAYRAACRGIPIDDDDVALFTEKVMKFWRMNHTKFPTWAQAARMTSDGSSMIYGL
ncbi:MAG: hypothetical protein SGPRY_014780, partial [Prymnesium sp.]